MVSSSQLTQDKANDLLGKVHDYVVQLIHAEGLKAVIKLRW